MFLKHMSCLMHYQIWCACTIIHDERINSIDSMVTSQGHNGHIRQVRNRACEHDNGPNHYMCILIKLGTHPL